MAFSELRNLSLSVHYRIWSILRTQGWYYTQFGVELQADTSDGAEPNTYFSPDITKPFVFLDDEYNVWPSGVRVYDMGNPLPSGRYVVDYRTNRITLTQSPSGAVTADLTISSVNVREGYPEDEELKLIDLPVIAYEVESDESLPFGVGTQQKWRNRYITIDILSTTDPERKDLTDNVGRYMSMLPYLNFSDHAPLDESFKLDTEFSFADQWNGNLHMPHGIRGDLLKPVKGGSDKERYRSLIAFECQRVS